MAAFVCCKRNSCFSGCRVRINKQVINGAACGIRILNTRTLRCRCKTGKNSAVVKCQHKSVASACDISQGRCIISKRVAQSLVCQSDEVVDGVICTQICQDGLRYSVHLFGSCNGSSVCTGGGCIR